MKKVFAALAGLWRRSRISFIIVAALAIGVVIAGLHDVGIVMGIGAGVVIFVEITRGWRRARRFGVLFFASVLGILLLSFVDAQVVKPLVQFAGGDGAVNGAGFQVFNQMVSLVILFFGVAGVLVGLLGAIGTGILNLAELIAKGKKEAKT